MGFEDLLLTPATGIFPLSADMWLQAGETVELKSANILNIPDADTLLDSLAQLQNHFLRGIEMLEQQEMDAELLRFQQRERLNHQVMEETLGELASVLRSPQSLFSPEVTKTIHPDEALLVAAGAVGRALGITIHPPAKSEDPKRVQDPLEAIARASRIRMRRIALRDNWWNKECGSMLPYTL